MFDDSTPFNTERPLHNKMYSSERSEYAAIIFAQSAKEPHEPQPQTARAATANRPNGTRQKTHRLFRVDENSIEQCCAAHIVQRCQQYCSALLSLN